MNIALIIANTMSIDHLNITDERKVELRNQWLLDGNPNDLISESIGSKQECNCPLETIKSRTFRWVMAA